MNGSTSSPISTCFSDDPTMCQPARKTQFRGIPTRAQPDAERMLCDPQKAMQEMTNTSEVPDKSTTKESAESK